MKKAQKGLIFCQNSCDVSLLFVFMTLSCILTNTIAEFTVQFNHLTRLEEGNTNTINQEA